jgi:hypothetical protein
MAEAFVHPPMRLLNLTGPYLFLLPESQKAALKSAYTRLVIALHKGVHPLFKTAASDLYHRSLRNNLKHRDISLQLLDLGSIRAKIHFLLFVRTKPLVRFTEYHYVALNELDNPLLQEIYQRIETIRAIRLSIFQFQSEEVFRDRLQAMDTTETFRLLGLLAQVTFPRKRR